MQNEVLSPIIFLVSYFIGSIPTAYLIAKLLKGIDIREHGSGNVGATNVFRVLGKKWGIIALLIDILKGSLAILVARLILSQGIPYFSWILLICGIMAILGHLFPVWLKFKGGKGVAVTAGIFIVLRPLEIGLSLLLFLIVVTIWRYVSLGSILAACSFSILVFMNLLNETIQNLLPYLIISPILSLLIIVMHRKNIKRLIGGTENKIFQSKKSEH